MYGTACHVIICHNVPTIFNHLIWLYWLHLFNRDPCQSEAFRFPTEQEPKPKPRQKLHLSHSQSGSRAALLQELDRLTNENKELNLTVQQLSYSSQNSGCQQSELMHILHTLRNKETYITAAARKPSKYTCTGHAFCYLWLLLMPCVSCLVQQKCNRYV
jgi:hypothetical protein